MSGINGFLMEHWLSVAVGVFLAAMMLYGHYRGFIRLAVSVGAMIISLAVVNIAMPRVNDLLSSETVLHQWIGQMIMEAADQEQLLEGIADAPHIQIEAIEDLNLPAQLKEALIENNNSEVYDILGVSSFSEYISRYLADLICNTVGYLIMYIAVYVLLRVFVGWLNLVARLPILSGLNQIAGACLGLLEGLLLVWLGCLLLPVFSGTEFGMVAMEQIADSAWLSLLYNMNIFPKMAIGILKGFL